MGGGFSIARHASSPPKALWHGPVRYVAPEILAREAYDSSADMFSFGVLMFELLSGQIAYSGSGARHDAQLTLDIRGGERPSLDVFSMFGARSEIGSVINQCLISSEARASASSLFYMIGTLLRNM